MPDVLVARALSVVRTVDAAAVRVLDGVDLDIAAGTLTDVSGPSGSGKTTLLLALARLLPDAGGTLTLDGVDADAVGPPSWRAAVAYLPQRASLCGATVMRDLVLPWRLAVRAHQPAPQAEQLRAALDRIGMPDVALDRDASRLSVGQAARVALLRVLLTRPRVLLLDEPDAGLDDVSAGQVAHAIDEFVSDGGAVVRVRHARADARASRRFALRGGRLEEVAR